MATPHNSFVLCVLFIGLSGSHIWFTMAFIINIIAQESGFSAMRVHLIIGSIISALTLLIGHYFPWHKILPEGKPLNRIWAYRYGSCACWAGFTYWRLLGAGDKATPLGLMIIYAIGGMTTQAAYWLDAKGQKKTIANRRRKSEELETLTHEDAYELFAEQK